MEELDELLERAVTSRYLAQKSAAMELRCCFLSSVTNSASASIGAPEMASMILRSSASALGGPLVARKTVTQEAS